MDKIKEYHCPSCGKLIDPPQYNWEYKHCQCGVLQAYEVKGILNWYYYPITIETYLSAFEE